MPQNIRDCGGPGSRGSTVLLYPEGMIQLNGSAGEILRRCDGERTLEMIIGELETAFATAGLAADVEAFLEMAKQKGWVQWSNS